MEAIREEREIGPRVREIRDAKKMTQQELLKRLQKMIPMTQYGLSKYETGSRSIKANQLIAFAKALEVDVEQILTRGKH